MPAYPINEKELDAISEYSHEATAAFAIAAFMVGIAFDLTKDLSMQQDLTKEVTRFWEYLRNALYVGFVLFSAFGIWKLRKRKSLVEYVKTTTVFPNGDR